MFFQHLVNALSMGAVYALIAIGYNMVYSILGKLNFAHGDLYTMGCFITFALMASGVNPFLAIAAGVAVGGLLNFSAERLAFKPLREGSRLAGLIAAIGIAYVVRNAIQLIWGPATFPFSLEGVLPTGQMRIGNTLIGELQIFILILAVAIMLFIIAFLKFTKWGQAITAISQSIPASILMGIPSDKVVSVVYILGGAVGVLGGVLFCAYYSYIHIGIGFAYGTMKAWEAGIIGGIGSLKGAVIGAFILAMAETFIAAYISASWKDLIVWALFLAFVMIKPKGLFPTQIAEKI